MVTYLIKFCNCNLLFQANGIKIGPQHSPSGAGLTGPQGANGVQGGGCC